MSVTHTRGDREITCYCYQGYREMFCSDNYDPGVWLRHLPQPLL